MALGIIQTGENGEDQFHLQLETQSREQLEINGGTPWLPYKSDRWRSPFILLIDDVLNPGNLGAIIRSAYFLGVDAIAISTRTCAPLNSEAVKASAGAIEAIPILAVHDVETFLRNSAVDARWKLYCATTPGPELSLFASEQGSLKFTKMKNSRYQQLGERHQCTFNSPLGQGEPVILAIGGEQRGLSRSVTKNAFAFVQIMPGINALDVGVDSLNVSAASAILCAEFMRSSPASLTRPTSVARPTRGRDMDASYSGWKAEGAMNDLNKRCKMESDRR
jgi:21S rRNA (GM2251-2'-O)-methyltransferase